jgi:hypothetical protein
VSDCKCTDEAKKVFGGDHHPFCPLATVHGKIEVIDAQAEMDAAIAECTTQLTKIGETMTRAALGSGANPLHAAAAGMLYAALTLARPQNGGEKLARELFNVIGDTVFERGELRCGAATMRLAAWFRTGVLTGVE